jgi:integrase
MLRSSISVVIRKHSNGSPYFQARFFDKSGHLLKSISFPKVKSRAEAYLCAREKLEEILASIMPNKEIEWHGILSLDEVRSILALPDDNPNEARYTLIAILGITCGLGVSEICNLTRDRIKSNDMILIETSHGKRFIPIILNVKNRLKKLCSHYPDSLYVIPNLGNMDKPCNQISVNRGLSSVLSQIGIGKERNIIPSVLWETFITLLSRNKKIEMQTLDYLCGFDMSGVELPKTNESSIRAIKELMMTLEKRSFWTTGLMKWDNQIH